MIPPPHAPEFLAASGWVITRSAHFIPNAGFRNAIAEFLEAEREGLSAEVEWLRRDLPYRSSSSE